MMCFPWAITSFSKEFWDHRCEGNSPVVTAPVMQALWETVGLWSIYSRRELHTNWVICLRSVRRREPVGHHRPSDRSVRRHLGLGFSYIFGSERVVRHPLQRCGMQFEWQEWCVKEIIWNCRLCSESVEIREISELLACQYSFYCLWTYNNNNKPAFIVVFQSSLCENTHSISALTPHNVAISVKPIILFTVIPHCLPETF